MVLLAGETILDPVVENGTTKLEAGRSIGNDGW
jgi:hypothetical protein